ncbi:hypothetical protein GALMADRAFT_231403 [Galerina marginata CBS 339.88]|uniref:Aminoglycoside phosphotransferase domain-containing protein n=1 Tax=Galerina marginata (strain CBS 339.88) TaxID=685588 RepID=A0A067SC12_GALM3|nr:hypothetical protein GALMADRAFT_231403 [Galerina marginata CBS 339.88]
MEPQVSSDDKTGSTSCEMQHLPSALVIRQLRGLDLVGYKLRLKLRSLRERRPKSFTPNVFLLDNTRLVKHSRLGGTVRLTEAIAMDYISKNTTIPVPRVHEVLGVDGSIHIVQEYIDGDLLDNVWHKLTSDEQRSSMEQLKGYLAQLQVLTPPHPGRVEAIDGSGCLDARLHSGQWGPFDNVEEFNRFFGHEYVREYPDLYPKAEEPLAKTYRRTWRTAFAHGDIGPHNIIWKNGKIVAIIDWECSGWFPEYWDYTRAYFGAVAPSRWSWWKMFRESMAGYPDELAVEIALATYFIRI